MNRINGWSEEETKSFVDYLCEEKKAGKALQEIFETYGKRTGRAKGSVKNFYYALLRSTQDERVNKMLMGTGLRK